MELRNWFWLLMLLYLLFGLGGVWIAPIVAERPGSVWRFVPGTNRLILFLLLILLGVQVFRSPW